jgi:hypothetical protein
MDRERAITYILKQEAAVSFGLAGKKLEIALEALRRLDGDPRHDRQRRAQLLHNAAYLLSAYLIQREALGLRDHADVNSQFKVPREVWNSVGVTAAPPSSEAWKSPR